MENWKPYKGEIRVFVTIPFAFHARSEEEAEEFSMGEVEMIQKDFEDCWPQAKFDWENDWFLEEDLESE